jgi:hypothetical protein
MNLNELRLIVRNTIRRQLKEIAETSLVPKSWGDFRKHFAEKLEMAGAPMDLVDEVGDVDSEGGGISQVLYTTWRNIKDDMDGDESSWQEMVDYYVHDAVIDMVGEFENSWNYAPGAKKGKKPIDAAALAKEVVKAWTPQKAPLSAEEKEARELKDVTNLVVDVLEQAGATGVEPGPKGVQYDMTDDLMDNLKKSCRRAGLKPAGPGTWIDDVSGLKVQFKFGTAKIFRG